ncbi:MAG: hypothetical protein RJA44_2170, partial [Pseudomonadota bacterium]
MKRTVCLTALLLGPALLLPTTARCAGTAAATEVITSLPEDDGTEQRFVRWSTRIDAPAALQPLLRRYLDLARFETLTQTEPITRAELNRLLGAAPAQVRSLLET